MKSKISKKSLIIMSIMILVDIAAIVGWVFYLDPDPSGDIVLVFAVPFVFLLNFVIGGIVYLICRNFLIYFVINAFVSSLILVIAYTSYVDIRQDRKIESWEFKIDDADYYISYMPERVSDFGYSVTVSYEPGSSSGYDRGFVRAQNDTVYFHSVDSVSYFIHKDYLYNFRGIEKIRVKKVR